MMKFEGSYEINIPLYGMFLNKTIQITRKNLITLLGESFFLNRAISDDFKPITFICLGNSSNIPRKKDLKLGNETIRKKCVKTIDFDSRRIKLSASFQANEIMGTKEIGIHNGDILITHDVYNNIDTLLTPTTGEITIDYYVELSSGGIRNAEWTLVSGKNYTYYLVEPNNVSGVIENNTGTGYQRVRSIDGVEETKSSYYYDNTTKNLYIHTSKNRSPSNEEIIVLTGE